MSHTLRWFGLLALVVAAFFWKILFTSQFSMIVGWEGANQAYAWYNYAARSIQQGVLPLWDPYTHSGYTFVGETQTGLFYPLKFLLYLWPFTNTGFLSERVFHQAYVLAHLLGAIFMFLCARELGIRSNFAAFVAAVCFTLGGFAGRQGWVHQMDSLIWLPLAFLFLLRALRADGTARRVLNACYGGLCLGVSLLAGSVHVPYMSVIFLVSAALFYAARPDRPSQASHSSPAGSLWPRLIASAIVIGVVGVVSFATSGLQLLPSMEYAPLATRWTLEWSGEFHQIIPYYVAGGLARMTPRAVFAFLFGMAETGGAEFGPYFGVMPLLLVIIGLWRNWANAWVKFLGVVALLAFVQGLGSYSLLHGLLYVIVPYIDKLWEAGRFIFLTHFAMALLVGFGMQTLLADEAVSQKCFAVLRRILQWIVITLAVVLCIAAWLRRPGIGEWSFASFFIIAATWAVFTLIVRGHRTRLACTVLVLLIVSDFYIFNTLIYNKMAERKKDADHLEEMHSLRPVADFLQSQPGPFRVHPDRDFSPLNWGDVYGVQSTRGYGATMLTDYLPALFSANGPCLFNVRYFVGKGADRPGVNPVFSSGQWKVYENPRPCPRAWVAQRVVVDSPDNVRKRIQQGGFDPLAVAYVSEPLPASLDASLPDSVEDPMDVPPPSPVITYGRYQADEVEFDVETSATGLLVLSEVYYPGWTASINGTPAPIYEVNSILRGVIVSPGANRIVMQYRPASVRIGALLTAAAFVGTLALAGFVSWKEAAKAP